MSFVQGSLGFKEAVQRHMREAVKRDIDELLNEDQLRSDSAESHSEDLAEPSVKSSEVAENRRYCQVQFKHVFRNFKLPNWMTNVNIGEFVIVQSFVDKSHEDLGVITQIYSEAEFNALKESLGPGEDADENKVGRVYRLAMEEEIHFLPLKHQRETPLLRICQAYVIRTQMPMTIYGVEYQFDGKVLHVYYVSKDRVDFRPLVKFLTKKHCQGSRVQMKKTTQCRKFVPFKFAAQALATGKHCPPDQS